MYPEDFDGVIAGAAAQYWEALNAQASLARQPKAVLSERRGLADSVSDADVPHQRDSQPRQHD